MDITSNFQKAVAKSLTDKKMTQLDLSVITGISQPSICRYLAGKRSPSLAQVVNIATALELNPIALLTYPQQVAVISQLL